MHGNAPTDDLWRTLLEAAIAEDKKNGKAAIARRLGVTRGYVSRALATGHTKSGFKGGVPEKFIKRVLDRFHIVDCPATLEKHPRSDCNVKANGPAPTHNPLAMRIWRECQRCEHKPPKG